MINLNRLPNAPNFSATLLRDRLLTFSKDYGKLGLPVLGQCVKSGILNSGPLVLVLSSAPVGTNCSVREVIMPSVNFLPKNAKFSTKKEAPFVLETSEIGSDQPEGSSRGLEVDRRDDAEFPDMGSQVTWPHERTGPTVGLQLHRHVKSSSCRSWGSQFPLHLPR